MGVTVPPVEEVLAVLRTAGVELSPGLSDDEVERVESTYGFRFGPEHRALLQAALPLGESWYDWRHGDGDRLGDAVRWAAEGIVAHAEHGDFWPASWGRRPDAARWRASFARERLLRLPALVPVYSHRCLVADPEYRPSPVFSAHETDVIVYGDDLLEYVQIQFGDRTWRPATRATYVPFWSDLARGAEDDDL